MKQIEKVNGNYYLAKVSSRVDRLPKSKSRLQVIDMNENINHDGDYSCVFDSLTGKLISVRLIAQV